jgi:Predicted membrane protein (DUF2207)
MDARALLDISVCAVAVGLWFAAFGLARLATRPASPTPAPATPDLGDEPPAVVSLLVNRWQLTEDAAEATLLDLAARGFFELRQPGNDPRQTTIHLPAAPPDASQLRPYERRVLDRVRGLAVGGVLPLTALTFRNPDEAKAWNKRLRSQVIADARAAGLSRRRFGKRVAGLLVAAALVTGVVVGAAVYHYGQWSHREDNPGFPVGGFTFIFLAALAGAPGERDTPLGQQVAARWLGVRAWLLGHEQFDELPPAAVAVWDRYLGYGAAVGATHLASAVLDLGMGDRKLVWSSYGGTWHRVRVRYPRFGLRYGRTVPILVLRAAIGIAVGALLVKVGGGFSDLDRVTGVIVAVGVLLLAVGVYSLARGVTDLATERTITGQVLWQEVWLSKNNENPRPWLHYLVVDDGPGDRTTAWGLPHEMAGRCSDGDTVTIRVRPWSRRVLDLEITDRSRVVAGLAE